MSLAIIRHPDYDVDLPSGHRFPMRKYQALATALIEAGLVGSGGFIKPPLVDRAVLKAVHQHAYVDAVFEARVEPAIERRIGLPVTIGVARRAHAVASGTVTTAVEALRLGIACNAAGGSHHAFADGGAGFCVFNDVAIAARHMLDAGLARQILVLDCDVHQGDGTAAIFKDEARVFTSSLHCEQNFPVRKQAGDLDIGLPRGAAGPLYLEALAEMVGSSLARSQPDLIFYNAGVDPHAEDALGYLMLTDADIATREGFVVRAAKEAGVPIACVLGGGYGPDVSVLAQRHLMIFKAAAEMVLR